MAKSGIIIKVVNSEIDAHGRIRWDVSEMHLVNFLDHIWSAD